MSMNLMIALTLSLLWLGPVAGNGQEKIFAPDLAAVTDGMIWKVFNATVEAVQADGKRAVRLKAKGDSANRIAGLALAGGVEFATGVIELDLKGKNAKQASFLGVVFNVADEKTFEAVYFRPFNFKAEEAVRNRSVQYIAWPDNTWQKLRREKPGQFENRVEPVPDPDGWFHARIEITDEQVRVFVDAAKDPCLLISRLSRSNARRPVGLFVDVAEGLYANLKITPANP